MPYADKDAQRAYQRAWTNKRRTEWLDANGPCVDCGSWNKLEVDHVDPTLKVSHRVWSWTEAKRLDELSKCVVRCNPCHKRKSSKEREPTVHGTAGMFYGKKCRCRTCKDYNKSRQARLRRQGAVGGTLLS